MKAFSKILFSLFILVSYGCSTTGGVYSHPKQYSNTDLNLDRPIALNVTNYLSFPQKYMNIVDRTIRKELSSQNKVIPMRLIRKKEPKFNDYVMGAISPNAQIKITNNVQSNLYTLMRTSEKSISDGFNLMITDGESFDNYEYSALVTYANRTQDKNFALSLLSAITVFAVPLVREHTMTVNAKYYKGTEEIGSFQDIARYDFSYGWGVSDIDNLHVHHARNLTRAVIENMDSAIESAP